MRQCPMPHPPPVRRRVPAPSLTFYFAGLPTFCRSPHARPSSSAAPHSPMKRLTRREAPEGHACQQRECKKDGPRSEEHTSELQSLMRISYAVICLKKKNKATYANLS